MIQAATGHRPDKLGGYGDEVAKSLFFLAVKHLEETKPDKIISGMALGWDMAWARAGIYLKIPVIAAVPFLGQDKMWPQASKDKYHKTLDKCSDILYICDQGYAPWKMQIRNEYMVDHCDLLVALWDGSKGGTGNCIQYAKKKEVPIINLWNKYNG